MWTRWGFSAGGWCRFFFSFSIKIIPADKGRASVVLDTNTNQTKMTFLIENRPYQHLNKVPRNRRTRKLPEGLLTLNRSRHVPKTVYYKIRPRRKQPPRIYGLPKLHKTFKTDCVIREQLRLWFVGVSRWQRISTNRKLSPLDQSEAKVKTVRRLSLSFFLRRFWTVSSVLLWVLIVF